MSVTGQYFGVIIPKVPKAYILLSKYFDIANLDFELKSELQIKHLTSIKNFPYHIYLFGLNVMLFSKLGPAVNSVVSKTGKKNKNLSLFDF